VSFLQIEHAVYAMGSSGWWSGIGIFSAYAAIILVVGRALNKEDKIRRFEKIWGAILLLFWIGKHIHLVQEGLWNIEDNLELHLCGFSRFLSIFLLLFGWRWAYYPLFFWGIVGGTHSLLTPELTSGDTTYMFIEYYVVHGGIIIIPLYYHFKRGMRIGRWTWAKILGVNLALMIPVGLANYFTNGNYMFLCSPPKVDNPFIIGEWTEGVRVCVDGAFQAFPIYILGFMIAGLLHYLVLTALFWKSIRKAEEGQGTK
jgi:hypothetical integral membrane protein (TIGR02206 family)